MHKLAIALLVSAVLATPPLAQTKEETGKDAVNKVAIPTNTFFKGKTASQYLVSEQLIGAKGRQQGWRSYRHDQRPDRRAGKSDRRNDTGGGWFPGDRREEDRRAHGSTEDFHRRRKDQHHSGQCHQGGVERGPCLPTSAAGQEITVVIENSGAISGSGFRDGCPGLNRERASPKRPSPAPFGKEPSLPRPR